MTVKELIELLQKYPDDTPIVREYDSSFEEPQVEKVSLYKDKYGYDTWVSFGQKFITEEVIVIHSGAYLTLTPVPTEARNFNPIDSNIVALEMERVLPKIKDLFERDDKFYSNLDKKK